MLVWWGAGGGGRDRRPSQEGAQGVSSVIYTEKLIKLVVRKRAPYKHWVVLCHIVGSNWFQNVDGIHRGTVWQYNMIKSLTDLE